MDEIFTLKEKQSAILKCFQYCVNSFKEKPLSPYEKECMYYCLETRINVMIEINNNLIKYEALKNN